jgi:hypothetical protein
VEIGGRWGTFHLFFSSVIKMAMSRMMMMGRICKSHGKWNPFEVGEVTEIKKEVTRVLSGRWRLGEILGFVQLFYKIRSF